MAKTTKALMPNIDFSLPATKENPTDPNKWFADRFPQAVAKWGPAFLEGSWVDEHLQRHIVPAHMNIDFMAGILGGDPKLAHQVVCSEKEDRFYFYDPMVDAFCPTTHEKLQALLSNYLVRCAQACSRLVDIRPLMVTFREKKVLGSVIEKAKALLQCDVSFFAGENGHRRYIDGRCIESTDEPSYLQFVRKGLVARPDSKLTLPAAFQEYYRFCDGSKMTPLSRSEFRHLADAAIRERFKVGIRHDVPGPTGKANHGWVGIECVLASEDQWSLN